ncbi:MAG TPA: alpha-amylase family glycosyl hydrolase, partial [Saprospiraceae bacterium]|nr:alpha-amylase family glycosyl hydrolase [Saprospiraceae bacterium]
MGIVALFACSPEAKKMEAPGWTKDLSIYEIMPRQYNEHRSLSGIAGDLDRIKYMFFKAICLLPVLTHDASNNAFNPNSAFALLSFEEIDPELGKPEDLVVLIDSAHAKGLKVITQWGFSFTGPHHPWRLSNPDYYLSADKMKDGRYNQDYVTLDLKSSDVQEELIRTLKRYLERFDFDGVMLYGLDHAPP